MATKNTNHEDNIEVPATDKGNKNVATRLGHKAKHHLGGLFSTKKRRIITIVAIIVALVVVAFAIPFTRYAILSPVIKKDISLTIVDSKTKQPVSNASVNLGSITAQSDKNGKVSLPKAPVGQFTISVSKQYYKDSKSAYTVPILSSPQSSTLELTATGRQVEVTVINKISGALLSDVVVSADGTKATTNSKGVATIILSPKDKTQKGTLSKAGYNLSDIELTIEDATSNGFAITPVGSMYFLSKATGKINVMKSNIDGSGASVAIEGTGQESDYETSLLSSRDWKYSVLSATRNDNKQRLYLVDTDKSDFTVLDEGNATFELVGWSGHNFVYIVTRNTGNPWDNRRQVLKSFNAETRKISVLDETTGSGNSQYDNAYEVLTSVYIMKDELVYLKYWSLGYYTYNDGSKQTTLLSVSPTGGSKKTIKTFPNNSVNTKLYEPQGLYVRVTDGNKPSVFYEYEEKAIRTVTDTNDNQFNSFYPTFLVSPTGTRTVWYEPRDGKNTVFIGDAEGKNAKTIGNLSEFTPYGWYGENDQYILLTKDGSELYISDANKAIGENGYQPLKVTDYHKTRSYAGYGYGYGGQ